MDGLHEQVDPDQFAELRSQASDHLIGRCLPRGHRLQIDEDRARVAGRAVARTDERNDVGHVWIGLHDLIHGQLALAHGLERNVLRRFGEAHQLTQILLGK